MTKRTAAKKATEVRAALLALPATGTAVAMESVLRKYLIPGAESPASDVIKGENAIFRCLNASPVIIGREAWAAMRRGRDTARSWRAKQAFIGRDAGRKCRPRRPARRSARLYLISTSFMSRFYALIAALRRMLKQFGR